MDRLPTVWSLMNNKDKNQFLFPEGKYKLREQSCFSLLFLNYVDMLHHLYDMLCW